MSEKIKILFKGWTEIPHSYSIVNGFQLIHLYKNFKDSLDIYIEEMPYYRQEWNNSKKKFFNDEYTNILNNFKKWRGESVDMIYSITYPYNILIDKDAEGNTLKKCVYYTSEFGSLLPLYFTTPNELNLNTNDKVAAYLHKNKNLYFTGPSEWSINGLKLYNIEESRNKLITNGTDLTIFYKKNEDLRKKIRTFYGVNDTDFLMMNIGAMTKNKGIIHILLTLHKLVNIDKLTHFKLLLKGTGDLYQSKLFLESYFNECVNSKIMTNEDVKNLSENNIIFSDKTMSYETINNLFNACDLYMSPYLAEGFNLTVLEAVTAGCNVLVPRTGSTKEMMEGIYENHGKNFIYYVNSTIEEKNLMKQNTILVDDIADIIKKNEKEMKEKWGKKEEMQPKYEKMREFIENNYSWNFISKELMKYFREIMNIS
jgi:glycosyltransferase involved in cell wall biosynthesis